jgi:hypothetical protein
MIKKSQRGLVPPKNSQTVSGKLFVANGITPPKSSALSKTSTNKNSSTNSVKKNG